MAKRNLVVDLFGDPVVQPREGRGRPEHLWSLENSNKVLLAFARGLTVKDAAVAIGISVPTLRKVYFAEVAKRQSARLRMEMTQLARLNAEAAAGNVAAEKELMKQMERLRLRDRSDALAPQPSAKPKKEKPMGKKEAQLQAAAEIDGLYAAPEAPNLLN